ncbi:MAG: DUF2326 domain-containing protein [Clostridia bacterium]|nr:DUF2326 domain-containing protein [Clostridia bacterium]
MLKEIRCNKFISNGVIRDPIRFHKGLNTVLGSASGSNSIGKSTFLMIIDFVFGGNDYAEKASDVQTNVGPHTIQFCFEFDGQLYYFSRSPLYKNEVSKCDSDYKETEIITLDAFRKFLHDKYQIKSNEQSFRGAVGNYFRVYLRECCDEGHPLKSSNKAPDKDGILELIKLFDKYDTISALIKEKKEAKDKETTYKSAISFNQISAPRTKSEYTANMKEIERLQDEIEELAEKSNAGLMDLDSVVAKRIADIKGVLSKLRRQRTRIKAQLVSLSEEGQPKKQIETNFSELLRFFPNADTKALGEVENFHAGLSDALAFEFKEKKKELDELLAMTEEEISKQEEALRSVSTIADVSRAILDSYADAMQRFNKLTEANKHYDEKQRLRQKVADIGEQIEIVFKSELSVIAFKLNKLMDEYNRTIYHEDRSAPTIVIKDDSHYTFDTPNDRGTGSRYKGLILFDLAVLKLTALPAVAHDSFMLKQIEDIVLEKLFEMYAKTEKQVFIAMDKETSYTERAREILNDSVVLRLSPDGNELFGRSWNKKTKEDK